MKAYFSQTGLEGGQADIVLTLEAEEIFVPDDTIALGYYTSKRCWEFLDQGGWNGNEVGLPAKGQVSGSTVTFRLERDHVDFLSKNNFRLILRDAQGAGKYETVLSVDGVRKSPVKEGGVIVDGGVKKPPVEKVGGGGTVLIGPPPGSVEPNKASNGEGPEGTPEPDDSHQGEGLGSTPEPDNSHQEGPGADDPPPVKPVDSEEAAQRKGKTGAIIGGIAALLAIAGLVGFFLMRSPAGQGGIVDPPANPEPVKEADNEPVKEADKEPVKEVDKEPVMEADKEPVKVEPEKMDTRAAVTAFFAGERKGERTAEGAMRLAAELVADTPEQQDAVFRLYYYAAEEHHAPGALKCAECFDPSLPSFGNIKKDAAEAWYYYGMHADGAAAREKMKNWVQDAANRGDANAKEWLKALR